MATFQGTETYLIECSRENSAINIDDDDDTNGSWANETDFVIKRGDKISVEMVCANIRGSGTSAPTIEFSGQNVVVNGETKNYCDTKVMLEVFFYMNNNNTYTVGLPLIHPNGGINGNGGTTGSGFTNLVSPYNLNPRIPQNTVTNQTRNYREVNMGYGYVFPLYDGYWNTPALPFFSSRIDISGVNAPVPQKYVYGIYQYQIENPVGVYTWLAPGVVFGLADPGRVSRVRIQPSEMSGQTTPLPDASNNLFTDYDNGIIKGRTGDLYQNNFYVGNHIYVNNNTEPDEADLQVDWVGQISKIFGTAGLGTPAFNIRVLELELNNTNTNYGRQIDYMCGDCAVYVGDTYLDDDDYRKPLFDIKPGSSQEGLMNYDNLDLAGISPVAGKFGGNGYMRGDNAMFLYARNTRKPQTGQNQDLNLFPSTVFDPTSFTADAGDYGELEPTAMFGYRNANIVKECNNDPYIFMRNDHFGSGRRGMNNEKMPLAEPMTAFIYISLQELLQDVNSVTAIINERLRETITGIGTTQQQTNKILLNSIENPDDRKPASNVVPYYNRVGFYDKDVTEITSGQQQNILMKQPVNTQYRNEITDIIPIKNGGCVKVQPANFTSGRDYLAQSYGKQYGGIPRGEDNTIKPSQKQLDNIKETTYLREIETSSQNQTTQTETISTATVIPAVPAVPEVPAYIQYTPQPDIYTPEVPEVPEVPESTIIYNSTADGSVALVSDFDVANNVSPMVLGNGAKLFTDDGGLNANYSTSHSRHATFDAGAGNCIYINPRAFDFEHSTYSMYDRLGITCSNTIAGLSTSSGNLSNTDSPLSQYLYQSSQSSPTVFWGTSWVSGNGGYGTGGGWIFPNSDGTDVKGNNNSGWINTWYKIDARYVRFWFKSDGSATEPGWDILVARAVTTPAVPAVPAVPGFYTPQPDLETLIPAVPEIPGVPSYTVFGTTVTDTITDELAEVNFQGWANPIYGNMATSNLYKYQLGDRWANLPIDSCDQINWTGADGAIPRQVGKTIILNNKLEYEVLDFTFPQGVNEYIAPLDKYPTEKPLSLICNKLHENQLLYTNIPFPNSDDGEKNWAAFAKAMRNYETYYNNNNNPPVGYKNQRKDIGSWIFDGDVGMTDDRTTAQLRTQNGSTSFPPPLTEPNHPYNPPPNWTQDPSSVPQATYQENRPFIYDWLNQPDTNAMLSTDPLYGTALGLPQPIVLPVPAGGQAKADYRPQLYDVSRTLICPTTTSEIFAGISARSNIDEEEKFRMLKELGRLKMKSRFQKDFLKIAKNFQGNKIINVSPPSLIDPHDSGFLAANNPPDPDFKVDTTFMEGLDLGFYPYTMYLGGGITKTFCAIMVGTDYTPDKTKLSTINFGSMCWGNSIGISNSFYDNHAICPVNNDQVKRGEPLSTVVTTTGEWVQIGTQETLGVETDAAYQAPLADANAYTQTTGIGAIPKTEWDFTPNFPGNPAYENPNVAGSYRLKLELIDNFEWGQSTTVIWEQSSLLTAGAVTGFSLISADDPAWTASSTPAGGRFTGLYKNPLLSATNTWVLTTGTGIISDVSSPPFVSAIIAGAFQCQGLGEPGAFMNGQYTGNQNASYAQYSAAKLYVYKFPTTSAGSPIPVNLGLEQNKVNYVWTGATQPTFQYDGDRGRVQFAQLQEDNILNQKSIPYTNAATNPSASTGTKAGIINTACEDAVFSRNNRIDDFQANAKTEPSRNTGVRAEISGIGIYKIWLCPENYEPPNNINLSSYWNNRASGQNAEGENEISYWGQTKINRDKIIKDCVEADENNWENSLFSRLGFQSHRELLPAYGKQENRFNPSTYNQTRPDKIARGTKPLILCNAVDNSIDPALNTYYSASPDASGVNGIPMYSNGFLNDESVSLQLVNQALTATAPPILSTSPFLLIESDICQTNYRSGRTQQNVLFYLMKNYQASSFIYGYGSSYTHTANQDRMLSLVNTALRDPITGRLQKCSSNSTIIYKIQRDVTILPPQTDALGNPLDQEQPPDRTDRLLEQIVINTESNTSRGGGGLGAGIGGGGKSRGGSGGGNIIGLQQALVGQAQEHAGATLNIVEGERQAAALEQMFAQIDANQNLTPEAKNQYTIMGTVIQRLIADFPVELQVDTATGMVMPATRYGDIIQPNNASLYNLAQQVQGYLTSRLREFGGIQGLERFMNNAGTQEGFDRLVDLLNNININPRTGERLIQGEEAPENFANFSMTGVNSTALERIASVYVNYFDSIDNEQEMKMTQEMVDLAEQARLNDLDIVSEVMANMMSSGTINLADPQGQILNPQPLGQSTIMQIDSNPDMTRFNSTERDYSRPDVREMSYVDERLARQRGDRDAQETQDQEPGRGETKRGYETPKTDEEGTKER